MSDPTWFYLTAEFKVGNIAVPIIQHMIDLSGEPAKERNQLPKHPFFDTPKWRSMLVLSSETHMTATTEFRYDSYTERYQLIVNSSFSHNTEIPLFLSWLRTFDQGLDGYRGFYQLPETDHPTLIYRRDGTWEFRSPHHMGALLSPRIDREASWLMNHRRRANGEV